MNNINDPTVSGQTPAVPPNNYAPSVPISLYREVTAELQSSRSSIDALKAQNQQLIQQNQQLQRQLENMVQAATQLQKAVNTAQNLDSSEGDLPTFKATKVYNNPQEQAIKVPVVLSSPSPTTSIPQSPPTRRDLSVSLPNPKDPTFPETPEQLFTEQLEGQLQSNTEPNRSELNGWWLIVSILLIVFTAFGLGYWIIRPLFQQR